MNLAQVRPFWVWFLIGLHLLAAGAYYRAFWGNPNLAPVRAYPASGPEASLPPWRLGDFSLIDSSGHSVTRRDLEGKPWVLQLIYTECPAQCPMVTAKMTSLQKSVPPGVGFISLSIDPQRDTPEKLRAYAARFGAAGQWLFLTGPAEQVRGILTSLGAPAEVSREAHSLRLYLLDRDLRIAGLFDSDEPGALGRLTRKASQLLET